MPKQIVIVGAGRQGRNAAGIFGLSPTTFPIAGFLDDGKTFGEVVDGWPVLGGLDRMDDAVFLDHHAWFVALGDNALRERIGRRLVGAGVTIVNAIHHHTSVSPFAAIGVGVYAAAFVHIYSGSRVGDWALVESGSVVGTDAVVGSAASLGPSAILTGGAAIGDRTFVGAGTVVVNDVRVGSDCIVAANAAVVRAVPDGVRVQGVPARPTPRSPV
jgi:UDP-perosamine 4-acetyltransferase